MFPQHLHPPTTMPLPCGVALSPAAVSHRRQWVPREQSEGLIRLCVCPGARPRAVFMTTGQMKGPAAPSLKDGASISLSVLKKTFEVNLNSVAWLLAEMCPTLSNPKKSKFLTPLNIKLISRSPLSHFLQRNLPEEVK